MLPRPTRATPTDTLCPYTPLFRSRLLAVLLGHLGGKADGARQVLLGGREHREGVLVALVEQRARGAFGLDHRHLVLLDDRRGRDGGRRAVGAEDVLHPVLLDQALEELRGAGRGRFVVVVLDRQLDRTSTRLNSSH